MKKLIIFDVDGTLLNTAEDIRYSMNLALEKYSLELLTTKRLESLFAHTAENIFKIVIPKEKQYLYDDVFKTYLNSQLNTTHEKTVLYDGLEELLVKLKKDGYKLALITNKKDDILKVVYDKKLKDFGFDFFMGYSEGLFLPKPDKSSIEYCLKTLNVSKEEAVYIGDSEVDVKTWQNAEIDGIGVRWGFAGDGELEKVGCKIFANTPQELYEKIKGL